MTLRDFLYLDRPLVRTFLAQAEGGEIDELKRTESTTGKSGVNARIGSNGLGVGAELGKGSAIETEAVVKQVAASEFDRLYRVLESDDLLILDDESDEHDFGRVRRKMFVEIDGRVAASAIQQLNQVLESIKPLLPVLKDIGSAGFDDSSLAAIEMFGQLGSLETTIPVVVTTQGKYEINAVLELDPALIYSSAWDVDASVLLKVQRTIKRDESMLIGNPLGGLMSFLPDGERSDALAKLSTPEFARLGVTGKSEVHGPGIVGTPVAIYR